MLTTPDGREVPVPEGVDPKKAQALLKKFADARASGSFPQFSDEDRQLMQQLRQAGVLGGAGGARQAQAGLAFGGNYIVFMMKNGQPTAVPVETGLTDLDYSEITQGLAEGDSILVLPSASLVQAQQEFAAMRQRMTGNIMPGVRVGGGGGGGAGGAGGGAPQVRR
jgi:hypothetical protein